MVVAILAAPAAVDPKCLGDDGNYNANLSACPDRAGGGGGGEGFWNSVTESGFRASLLVGAMMGHGPTVRPVEEPFNSAVPEHENVLSVEAQLGYEPLDPKGLWRPRISFMARFLGASVEEEGQEPDSTIYVTTFGTVPEITVHPWESLGFGLQLTLGWNFFSAEEVQTGTPFTGDYTWGDQNGFVVSPKVFVDFGVFRAGAGADWMPYTMQLDAGPGQPNLELQQDPYPYFFLGADLF